MPLAEVRVKGLDETTKLLKAYAPEQAKEINKRITTEANKIRDRARGYMPNDGLSNWGMWTSSKDGRDLGYLGAWAQKGIKSTRANYRARGQIVSNYIGLVSGNAGAAIFQTVGRGDSNSAFVENFTRKNPEPRSLWRAFDELKPQVQPSIMAAIDDATKIVNAKLNQLGGE